MNNLLFIPFVYIMSQHELPIKELKKNYLKLLSKINNKDNSFILDSIKNDIDIVSFNIKNELNNLDQDYPLSKQEYIDIRLQPAVLLFAITYSAHLAEEYDSTQSLSEPSDGT